MAWLVARALADLEMPVVLCHKSMQNWGKKSYGKGYGCTACEGELDIKLEAQEWVRETLKRMIFV